MFLGEGSNLVRHNMLCFVVAHLVEIAILETSFRLRDMTGNGVAHVFADQHLLQSINIDRLVCIQPLDTLNALVRGMLFVGHDPQNTPGIGFVLDDRPTTHAAIGTLRETGLDAPGADSGLAFQRLGTKYHATKTESRRTGNTAL